MGKWLRGAGERLRVVDEAAGLRAVSAVRKWSQGAGERRLCIKGWRVWCD